MKALSGRASPPPSPLRAEGGVLRAKSGSRVLHEFVGRPERAALAEKIQRRKYLILPVDLAHPLSDFCFAPASC